MFCDPEYLCISGVGLLFSHNQVQQLSKKFPVFTITGPRQIGLASYLLGIENEKQVARDPLPGGLFENMVVIECVKSRTNIALDSDLYFYRP